MPLKGAKIGFALTGSFCTLYTVTAEIQNLVDRGADVVPIISKEVATLDTRFGRASELLSKLREITGHSPILSIVEAEPIGPNNLFDILVVAPCTGNTLAKLANAITDGPVLMSIKSQLRNQKPVALAISTNDGLSMNARNLGVLMNTKNVYLVPFGQDNPRQKANSLVSRIDLLVPTVEQALQGRQIQPVLVFYG